jgi:transposase
MIPEWVKQYQPPKTEVRDMKGKYYVYEVSSKRDKTKGRAKKITGKLLGKITSEGFIESNKRKLEKQALSDHIEYRISAKEYGSYYAAKKLLGKEIEELKNIFPDEYQEIFVLSYLRFFHNITIKNTPYYLEHSFASEEMKVKLTEKTTSTLYEKLGKSREKIIKFKQTFNKGKDFLAIDMTNIISESKKIGCNQIGYNSKREYKPQINFLCIFSNSINEPLYYRLLDGNIREVRSFKLSLIESGIKDAVIITDKGFYSNKNIQFMEEEGLNYIVPLRRNNSLISESLLAKKQTEVFNNYFIYQGRAIWYCQYQKEGKEIILFLDKALKTEEENDYIMRIESHPEDYSIEGYKEKESKFGILGFTHNIKEMKPQEIYLNYKTRNNVELFFDGFKNIIEADQTYMQNKYTLEGWMFVNFIAMRIYYKLLNLLKSKELLTKYSPKDISIRLNGIFKLRINQAWYLSEINTKVESLLNSIDLCIT